MAVCYYYVTHAFQSESTFYRWLTFRELLARNRRDISSLSDYNGMRFSQTGLNGWGLFVYELSGCWFESRFQSLNPVLHAKHKSLTFFLIIDSVKYFMCTATESLVPFALLFWGWKQEKLFWKENFYISGVNH